ncbi:MAG: hypothetical protein QME40_04535 [bacterium]|nr:hypothetical protein [bacterium]
MPIDGINLIISNLNLYPSYGNTYGNQYKGGGEIPPDVEDAIVRYKKANPDIDLQGLQNLLYNQKGVRLDKREIEKVLRKHKLLDDNSHRLGNEQNSVKEVPAGRKEGCDCQRRYQCSNGETSDGMSTRMSGPESLTHVPRHEMEHATKARARAAREGKEVVSIDIKIQYATCPECGMRYAIGGKTTVRTRPKQEYKQEEVEIELPGAEANKKTEEGDRKVIYFQEAKREIVSPFQSKEPINKPINTAKEGGDKPTDSSPLSSNKDFNPYAGRYDSVDRSNTNSIDMVECSGIECNSCKISGCKNLKVY